MDPSRIQRVVLLIDLYPLLDLQNPHSYLSPILSTARRILSFAPLASSLFAYKLFFSSLSPILSTSTVHRLLGKSSTFLSFDCPASTLHSLSRTLDSLRSVSGSCHSAGHGFSRASLLAKSLLQLEHDYGWEPPPQDRKGSQELLAIRSNLVMLFSPMYPGPNYLSERVDLELGGESDSAMSSDAFLKRLLECFGLVKERLAFCDIHLSWVDVNFDYHCERDVSGSEFFERGIRELGWGFCSTDAIVLGSALVPFGLVFPYVGCALGFAADSGLDKGTSELVLEIIDVYGKPLECKSCELEVLDLKPVRERSELMGSLLKVLGSKTSNIRIREVWRSHDGRKVMNDPSNLYLIRGNTGECNKVSRNHAKGEFFADSILRLLCREKGELVADKPLWQILLTFLYNRSYWASVSIYNSDDKSMEGILIPFTVNYALLAVPQKNSLNSCQLVARKSRSTSETLHAPVLAGSREDSRRKRKKLHLNQIQNATLSSFREFVSSQTDDVALGVGLEELYSGKIHDKSKKLMFLKCWMRQIVTSNSICNVILDEQKEPLDIKEDVETRNVASQDVSEADAIPSSTEDAHQSASSANKDAPIFSCMEDMETFLRSIPQKIEQGLCSLDTDFGNLAERLVGLCIRALDAQIGKNVEEIISDETGDASYVKIADEVSRLLLVKPRDLLLKYKTTNPARIASSNPVFDVYNTEYRIREHELQILFRMEILCSSVGPSIEDNTKQKMIKDICSLLQFIDINLEGDSFCGQSIVEFAERTIKCRYSHSLKDVIDKIYNQMEFGLFDEDEVGASDSLPNSNSEDFKRGDFDDGNRFPANPIGAPGSEVAHQEKHARTQQEKLDNAHERRLMRAQERRNRDRRFSSFTSWVPDLQRVWALKQPKAERLMRSSLPKPLKRRRRHSPTDDRVCETPMMDRKVQSQSQEDDCGGMNRSNPLSKALFRHEGEHGSGI
ncbi:hypothetical protein MUK42_23832 [Musa troglodytarum]|uniref:Treslin n=1 Tax=Musa troglodytarum TaxID=320322 RepID=A0A9E7K8X6_9LILI|nr:hypothetical protein MUK42_23832 [Musa troglodytarum]